ncbi:hypothetical protein GW17_00060647 [Ensete ventricosum]|nr:hypothetical protein GW17_00060647 [Ensete ventricosum]RZS24700.1 hypothetical protein BHM03_00057812 [Ensete ventricosum]
MEVAMSLGKLLPRTHSLNSSSNISAYDLNLLLNACRVIPKALVPLEAKFNTVFSFDVAAIHSFAQGSCSKKELGDCPSRLFQSTKLALIILSRKIFSST